MRPLVLIALLLSACGPRELDCSEIEACPEPQPEPEPTPEPSPEPTPEPEPEPEVLVSTRICSGVVDVEGAGYSVERTVLTYSTEYYPGLPHTVTTLEIDSASLTVEDSSVAGPIVLDGAYFYALKDEVWALRGGVWVTQGAALSCVETSP